MKFLKDKLKHMSDIENIEEELDNQDLLIMIMKKKLILLIEDLKDK